MTRFPIVFALAASSVLAASTIAHAAPGRDAILAGLTAEAQKQAPGLTGFSAARGEALFRDRHGGGKPATPSCTTCHRASPLETGATRAGKPIAPMAVSRTPDRFTDPAKVAKWFRRNCKSVLGRECTALEKGDFITFMATQ